MTWFALIALPAVALRSVFYACASAIFAFHFCYPLIWNMKVEYPFWKLVFEGFKGTKIQRATVIAAFVLPVKGKLVLKVRVLIIELKSSPNLKHYRLFSSDSFNIATLLLCSGCIILNKTKTPDFTFLGVKLGVCFAICWFSAFVAEKEGFEPPVQLPVHRISSAARSTTPASLLEDRSPKPSFWDCKYRHIFYIRAFSDGKNCVRAKKKLRTGAFARPGLLPVPE